MIAQTVEQLSFDFLPQSALIVQRAEGQLTSDAGLLPLAQFDRRWRYTERIAACLELGPDHRGPRGGASNGTGRAPVHQRQEMVRQRVFGILGGYEDCNDHSTLRSEPVFKLIADRLPQDKDLASQPTLSRFENAVTPDDLFRFNDLLIATGIEVLKRRHGGALPRDLILDLDATDDPTHGHQQLSLFHGYFEQHQYFPLIISEPTSKHIFGAWLRPGTVHASLGAPEDLMRVVEALKKERPDIRIHVRADGGFGVPAMYEVCENHGLTYTLGFSTNERLKVRTQGLMDQAVSQYQGTQQKQRLFMRMDYQADSWDRQRTVVAKAECHAQGTNLRFVVTNLPAVETAQDAQRVYDDYTQRGESEQRMDELKNGLKMDRLSCHRFMANLFRLLLHVAAFNLLNAVRQSGELPQVLRVAQPCTWRMTVIKVAAEVIQTTRRVIVRLAANWPWWTNYVSVGQAALSLQPSP
jgi:hypothetical protein